MVRDEGGKGGGGVGVDVVRGRSGGRPMRVGGGSAGGWMKGGGGRRVHGAGAGRRGAKAIQEPRRVGRRRLEAPLKEREVEESAAQRTTDLSGLDERRAIARLRQTYGRGGHRQGSPTSSSSSSAPAAAARMRPSLARRLRSMLRRGVAPPEERLPENYGDTILTCLESSGSRRVVHRATTGQRIVRDFSSTKEGQFEWLHNFHDWASSFLLPDGYPHSVTEAFTPYMQWRAVQYFFGGALGVFTTRSLFSSLGVGSPGKKAAALNWVLKDGAGRLGRMVFARYGKQLDNDLKQFRFLGDLLMETGAALELSTMLFPRAFLPLACVANISKNVAVATAHATRSPIYKAFAAQNNIGDITAKGESIGNLADIVGLGVGVMFARLNPPILPTFLFLSSGYVLASVRECSCVQLPIFNHARLAVTAHHFFTCGEILPTKVANLREPLWNLPSPPWELDVRKHKVMLGTSIRDAFDTGGRLARAVTLYEDEAFMLSYRPDKRNVYVVLREGVEHNSQELLRTSFHAHLLLHRLRLIQESKGNSEAEAIEVQGGLPMAMGTLVRDVKQKWRRRRPPTNFSDEDLGRASQAAYALFPKLYPEFIQLSEEAGWTTGTQMLSCGNWRYQKPIITRTAPSASS